MNASESKTESKVARDAAELFVELIDLGILTVPSDYDHSTHLDKFKATEEDHFRWGYNADISDVNFPNPTRILKPGDQFRVRAFQQIVPDKTTSDERMEFLATQEAIFTGAQGLALVWKQMSTKLPKGKLYSSMDKKENLWKDARGRPRMPYVNAVFDGGYAFNLGLFQSDLNRLSVLLCFKDVLYPW